MSREFESEIRLHRIIDIGFSASVHSPAAVGELRVEQVFCTLFCQFGLFFAEKGEEHNGFALQESIAFEFGDPISVGMLVIEEKLPGRGNAMPELLNINSGITSGGHTPLGLLGRLIHIVKIRFHALQLFDPSIFPVIIAESAESGNTKIAEFGGILLPVS
jgi:hypothetical protein